MEESDIQIDWQFPTYVGHTRRLLPTDDLFQDTSYPHDVGGKTAARAASKENSSFHESQERALLREYRNLVPKNECTLCRALLPTAHLLDLHLAEVHDSFFAAQAARKLPVYCCLVESCDRKFSTIEQRKQHLMDFHQFPKGYSLDRIHLRHKKGQTRPLQQYRQSKNSNSFNTNNAVDEKGRHEAEQAGAGPMAVDEELVEGMSRLRMAASLSAVPRSVAFGHRRGGFMPGLVRGKIGSRSDSGGGGAQGNPGGGTSRDNIDEMNKE